MSLFDVNMNFESLVWNFKGNISQCKKFQTITNTKCSKCIKPQNRWVWGEGEHHENPNSGVTEDLFNTSPPPFPSSP